MAILQPLEYPWRATPGVTSHDIMPRINPKAGPGAQAIIRLAHIHPSEPIREKGPNTLHNGVVEGAKLLRVGTGIIRREEQPVIYFTLEEFGDREFYVHITQISRVTVAGRGGFSYPDAGGEAARARDCHKGQHVCSHANGHLRYHSHSSS